MSIEIDIDNQSLKKELNFSNGDKTEIEIKQSSNYEIYRKIAFLGIQAFLVFFVTFLLFPGTFLATKLDMFSSLSSRESWFVITMVTVYAVIDFIGRWFANVWVPFNEHSLLYLTLSRIVHIPLCLLIQLYVSPHWLFDSDWFKLINVSIFGFTQGY